MNQSKQLIIFDIGCHKLEELSVLLRMNARQFFVYVKWVIYMILRSIKRMDFSGVKKIGQQFNNISYYFFSQRKYNIKIIAVEPNMNVANKYVNKLARKYSIHYIPAAVLGHDSESDVEFKKLFFYDDTISSSIYKKNRPMDEDKASLCVGLKFSTIWDNLLKEDDPFLLRMNCEGSELGVMEGCCDRNLKPLCIIGSIADVDKIHGKEIGDKAREIMDEAGIKFYYFKGDDPSTWFDMIEIWDKHTSGYLIK